MAQKIYWVSTQATTLRAGDRIKWRRDHMGERVRTGVVAHPAERPGWVYAHPDDGNFGPEPNGGTSEITNWADIGAEVTAQ